MTGPCAKATVRCELHLKDSRVIVGTNACANPQSVCPRLPGEDYTKCRTICDQQGHAEVQALRAAHDAGHNTTGAVAIISGHTYACMDCQHALFGAGVVSVGVKQKGDALAQLAAVPQWISVEERLPELEPNGDDDINVYTWDGKTVEEDIYGPEFDQPAGPAVGGWVRIGENFGDIHRNVTHWMPRALPAAPTKDTHD